MHGKQSRVQVDNSCKIFKGLTGEIDVARYHSLAADKDSLPEMLKAVAITKDGEIMAVAHNEYEVYGLQFHPESILTTDGKRMVENFIA